ncbi:hypothetical protein ACFYZ2_01540 [Streptomyces sviceus]|uniref:hypothetical protein n=1 Tax=Streptomyces sviceus TaxID=285530 RepID=UPI0036A6FE85
MTTKGEGWPTAVQYVVLEHTVPSSAANRDDWSRTASALHALGVRPPCPLSGYEAVPVAFYAGCGSAQTGGHDTSTTAAALARTARRTTVAVLAQPGDRPSGYARTWPQGAGRRSPRLRRSLRPAGAVTAVTVSDS